MNLILLTTTRSPWYQEKADKVAKRLSNTKGRGKTTIDVVHISPPNPYVIHDGEHYRIGWDWFSLNFPTGEYNGIVFHFTPYYKKKWGISREINGSRNSKNKDYPEFWLCCEKEAAHGYEDLSNFERLLYHELGHFDEDIDDNKGNLLPQESVHMWDYKLKQIHNYHILVDYTGHTIKEQIRQLFINVIQYVSKTLSTPNK